MSKDLRNVLLGILQVFINILLMNSLLNHALVLRIQRIFWKLNESLLLFEYLFGFFIMFFPHIFCNSSHIALHYQACNFRLWLRYLLNFMRIIFKLSICLLRRWKKVFNSLLLENKTISTLFSIFVKVFNHICYIHIRFLLLLLLGLVRHRK